MDIVNCVGSRPVEVKCKYYYSFYELFKLCRFGFLGHSQNKVFVDRYFHPFMFTKLNHSRNRNLSLLSNLRNR